MKNNRDRKIKQKIYSIDSIAILAHELKTPVITLKEAISLLTDLNKEALNIKNRRIIAIAQEEVDRLLRMVDNFLKFASIGAGKIHLEKEKIKIEDIINSVLEIYSLKIQSKSMHINKLFSKNTPDVVVDWDRMFEAIANILDNALKYTPTEGTITVKTQVVNQDHYLLAERQKTRKHNYLLVTVADTGPGILKNDLERIFEKFERGKTSENIRGIGLGLTITRNIIKLHNGEVWATSKKNKGAQFYILLPIS